MYVRVYIQIFEKGKSVKVLVDYFFHSLFVSDGVLSVLCKVMMTYPMILHITDSEKDM